ncbi:MAG TPA: hypothetical protein VD840_12175, partial [Sinorhizobium sp.]|nr:hypothetical protein [Sinorhizobium sp.]
SKLSKWMTIGFVPAGSAVYLFQSRDWKSAAVMYLAFWGGLILAVIAAALLSDWLISIGVLGGP